MSPDRSAARSGLAQADDAARGYSAADRTEVPAVSCPRSRHVIEACVLGDDDLPLKDAAVELRNGEAQVIRGRTDRKGMIRFDGLDSGDYQLALYALDADAWEFVESVPLAEDAARGDGQAAWTAPADPAPGERTHLVEQGDSTAKIAERHGFFADTVWDWPANAALKAARGDKNILLAGDRLAIPPRRAKQVPAQVARRHVLRRKGVPEVLKLRFRAGGKPRRNLPYLASLVYGDGRVAADCTGTTGAEGEIALSVMPGIETARITLGTGASAQTHVVQVGYLDPASVTSGMQRRLANLGYYRGAPDGQPGDALREALRGFQRDQGIEVTGEIDGATRDKILEKHGA